MVIKFRIIHALRDSHTWPIYQFLLDLSSIAWLFFVISVIFVMFIIFLIFCHYYSFLKMILCIKIIINPTKMSLARLTSTTVKYYQVGNNQSPIILKLAKFIYLNIVHERLVTGKTYIPDYTAWLMSLLDK